jgi:hypothetical protein
MLTYTTGENLLNTMLDVSLSFNALMITTFYTTINDMTATLFIDLKGSHAYFTMTMMNHIFKHSHSM